MPHLFMYFFQSYYHVFNKAISMRANVTKGRIKPDKGCVLCCNGQIFTMLINFMTFLVNNILVLADPYIYSIDEFEGP